jgi:hypothetical protein
MELDEEQARRIRAFRPIFDEIMGEASDDDYLTAVLVLGLRRMLFDVLGNDPNILAESIWLLFDGNPEYVGKYVVQTIREGKQVQKENADRARADWSRYIG